ncbi:MAG TPA: alpha/beta hydrolase [Acidimicrobiales bacterium]|jgi:pimeloyl-ACP methyl ester carboxylesterase
MTTVTVSDGRTVGYAEFGDPEGHPVLWCHGGPGNRLESAALGPSAAERGLRLVGIDRPGYGLSTPQPGRSIAEWVPDGIAVADELGLDHFAVVGCSTGGAYALALASLHPERVDAVVAACALTDMSWPEGRAMVSVPTGAGRAMAGIWDAPDRATALSVAESLFGADGSGTLALGADGPPLPAADIAFMTDPELMPVLISGMRESFTFGVEGYADDRIADGAGWTSFDVSAVRCPVVVLHGSEDTLVPVAQAPHTASLVSNGSVRIVPALGHFSIMREVVPTLAELLGT